MKCWVSYWSGLGSEKPYDLFFSKEEALENSKQKNKYLNKIDKYDRITKIQEIEVNSDYLIFRILTTQGSSIKGYFLTLIQAKDSNIKFGESLAIM